MRYFLALVMTAAIWSVSSPVYAEKRVALIIGNSDYQNIPKLENPRNDALLMASTLKQLGFILVNDGAQLDLDKAALDSAVQKFSVLVQGADVGMFYYAGHGIQVRGSNYLVPVNSNPAREADVDFQMVDVNVVLRQMEAAGTKLNLLVLDACRNNPFGGTGLRAANGGLAQMRAPEGTLISFATQPGNVAQDGDGNSPYTKALAATVLKPGLDIFRTFNEVGLAVKRSTGGEQQPWVSSSPIDGNFSFVPANAPADSTVAVPDQAAQAWAATRDTASPAVLEAFVRQYGNSLYAPFARARLDELKSSQTALAIPKIPSETRAVVDRLTKADVVTLFEPFDRAIDLVHKNYIEKRDDRDIFTAANNALRTAYSPGAVQEVSAQSSDLHEQLDTVRETALKILNAQPTNAEDTRIVEVAIKGVLAFLDPHSNYINAQDYRAQQTQIRGTFGGVGIEASMTNGLFKVVSAIDGAPAAKAGVRANDIVMAVDGVSIQGLTLNQAVAKLRGPVGSEVHIKLVRPEVDNPIDVTLTRDVIRLVVLKSRLEDGDVGYIKISSFNEQSDENIRHAVQDLSTQAKGNLKGFVVDLRNSSGGLLNSVIAVSDDLLDKGQIVSTHGRDLSDIHAFVAKKGDITDGKPIVVLINGGTASGSEIMAGALQDNKRAVLVGTRSFGNGSVQTIFPLGPDRGAIRLTTSRYYTPSGKSIQALGIVPDREVLQQEPESKQKTPSGEASLKGHLPGQGVEQVASQSYVPPDLQNDAALAAAIGILKKPPGSHDKH